MFRFTATVLSFFLILGGYYLYGWVLVPTLLPQRSDFLVSPDDRPKGQPEELTPYLALFAEESWERNPDSNVQLLVIGRTVALFQHDEIEGSVARLTPCTLIILPDDEDMSDAERIRQAVVLQTPGHAEIDFDGELNFSRFPLPKMTGGKLIGPVVVRSDMQDPGARDDFFLETENIVFTDRPEATTIDTLKDVRFRFGYSTGEGTVLNLTMGLSNPRNPKSRKILSQVKFDRLKQLNLVFPDGDGNVDEKPQVAASSPAQPVRAEAEAKVAGPLFEVPPLTETGSEPTSPSNSSGTETHPILFSAMHDPIRYSVPLGSATMIDIHCQREFQFLADTVPDSWNAVFEGDVKVDRTNPEGTKDHLTCEKLLINFRPKIVATKNGEKSKNGNSLSAPPSPASAGTEDALGDLEPASLHAMGRWGYGNQAPVPARLIGGQNGDIEMEGDHIVYDLRKNLMMIKTDPNSGPSPEVRMFLQNRYRIASRTGFDYMPGKDGNFGTLTSVGAGNLRGNAGDEKTPKNVFLSWNAMQISQDKIDPQRILVELKDGITAESEELGKMTAKQLQLWCFMEKEENTVNAKKQTAGSPLGPGGNLVPDRATVMENVRFENAKGVCIVKKLDIFFETVSEKHGVIRSRWFPQLLTRPAPACKNPDPSNTSLVHVPAWEASRSGPAIRQVQYDTTNPSTFIRTASTSSVPLAPLVSSVPPNSSTSPPVGTAKSSSVRSQNLLGIGTSGDASMYEIVGDQMKMNVRREGSQSQVERIWIGGNVRIQEKISGREASDAVEITGDEVWLWAPDSSDTIIQISGRESVGSVSPLQNESQYATFRGKGIVMKAFQVFIFRANNQIHVDGPGRLVALTDQKSKIQIAPESRRTPTAIPGGVSPLSPLAPLSPDSAKPLAVPEQKDGPLIVEWNKEMFFDGQTLVFLGTPDQNHNRVMGSYQTRRDSYRIQKIYCDILKVHLNRFVSLFDDDSDDEVEATVLACEKNVYIESELFDESGREKKSYERGRFEAIQIELKTDKFLARGPGQMFSTSPDTGKGFSLKQDLPGGVKPDSGKGELSFLGVWFSDNIQGRFSENRKVAVIQGRVKTVFCPVQSWKDELDLTQLTAATRRGYLLECDQMEIAQMPDPADARKSTMELKAHQNARIEGNTFYGKADTIKYNQAKSLVVFEGNAWVTSENEELPAQRIEYNIETGAMQMSHAQGFSSGK